MTQIRLKSYVVIDKEEMQYHRQWEEPKYIHSLIYSTVKVTQCQIPTNYPYKFSSPFRLTFSLMWCFVVSLTFPKDESKVAKVRSHREEGIPGRTEHNLTVPFVMSWSLHFKKHNTECFKRGANWHMTCHGVVLSHSILLLLLTKPEWTACGVNICQS